MWLRDGVPYEWALPMTGRPLGKRRKRATPSASAWSGRAKGRHSAAVSEEFLLVGYCPLLWKNIAQLPHDVKNDPEFSTATGGTCLQHPRADFGLDRSQLVRYVTYHTRIYLHIYMNAGSSSNPVKIRLCWLRSRGQSAEDFTFCHSKESTTARLFFIGTNLQT